jgi:hypothetical protein
MAMLRTAELDMTETITESDIADFLTNAAWVVRSTYHTVLKTSPGAAIFGRDMLFDVPFLADWSKIGEFRQKQTDKNTVKENYDLSQTVYNLSQQHQLLCEIRNGVIKMLKYTKELLIESNSYHHMKRHRRGSAISTPSTESSCDISEPNSPSCHGIDDPYLKLKKTFHKGSMSESSLTHQTPRQ